MNAFNKMLIIAGISVITVIIGSIFIFHSIITEIDKTSKEMQDKIGSKIILNNDTLMIINYSILNDAYILENNTEISTTLIDKIGIIEN